MNGIGAGFIPTCQQAESMMHVGGSARRRDYSVQWQASMSEAEEDVLRQLVDALWGFARPRRRPAELLTSRRERNLATGNTLIC